MNSFPHLFNVRYEVLIGNQSSYFASQKQSFGSAHARTLVRADSLSSDFSTFCRLKSQNSSDIDQIVRDDAQFNL
jgi:hypothetical protein